MEGSRFIQFVGLLNRASKSIQALKMMKMEHYQLSAAHTNCLCRLAEFPEGLTQTHLAELENMDRAQVSRVLRELEEKNYAVRTDSGGAYKRQYVLTPRGVETVREMEEIILRLNHYVSGEISDADLAVFYRTFHTITKNLSSAEALVANGLEEEIKSL